LTQRPGGTQATRSPRAAGDAWDNPRRIGYPQIQEVVPHPKRGPTLFVVREPLLTTEPSEFLSHLYLIPFRVAPRTLPALRRLTGGPTQVLGFDWLPDSRGIAFSHRPLHPPE
jgi:hypothetical protein